MASLLVRTRIELRRRWRPLPARLVARLVGVPLGGVPGATVRRSVAGSTPLVHQPPEVRSAVLPVVAPALPATCLPAAPPGSRAARPGITTLTRTER